MVMERDLDYNPRYLCCGGRPCCLVLDKEQPELSSAYWAEQSLAWSRTKKCPGHHIHGDVCMCKYTRWRPVQHAIQGREHIS
jgi:hypothetical protein